MINDGQMRHMEYLQAVALGDVEHLREKESTYRGSWKASGGRSAWFMLRRKIDRLLVMMSKPETMHGFSVEDLDDALQSTGDDLTIATCVVQHLRDCYVSENVFAKIREAPGGEDGTVLAEIRDLRRYLLLVEAEMAARGVVAGYQRQLPTVEELEQDRKNNNMMYDEHGPCAPGDNILPGTPEDGGHHEPRLPRQCGRVDIVSENSILNPPTIALVDPIVGQVHVVVDRRLVSDPASERFARELNNTEHELTPAYFRGLWKWHSDIEKWLMIPEYVEHWGR